FMLKHFSGLLAVAFLFVASAHSAPRPQSKSPIYTEGDFALRQLVTPGFERLPLDRKIFVYHLTQAINAGRDIYWQQNTREGLALRNLLESMWSSSGDWPSELKEKFLGYLFRVYTFRGNYSRTTYEKFVPQDLTEADFLRLAALSETR